MAFSVYRLLFTYSQITYKKIFEKHFPYYLLKIILQAKKKKHIIYLVPFKIERWIRSRRFRIRYSNVPRL